MRRGVPFLLLFLPVGLAAQRPLLDLSAGATDHAWRVSLTGAGTVALGPLTVGTGARLTRYGGDAARYRTHDAPPAGASSRLLLAPGVWSLNLVVLGDLHLAGPIGAGANLDVAGIAWGGSQCAGTVRLAPARWSLFRYGDNDRGSLTSEFFVRATTGRLAWRAGVSHYVTGYRVAGGGARYLRFDTVPFVAVTWRV